jgi:4-hydroxybenzoate polyprenyltransferase
LENKLGPVFKAADFAIHTNIFIAACAASLTAYAQKVLTGTVGISFVLVTFSATLILYNIQRMYLSFFRKKYSFKNWQYKNKYPILILMLACLPCMYPILYVTSNTLIIYAISFLLGIFYFLPFSNLRRVPLVKSFTVGLVWVLVCVVAPLNGQVFSTSRAAFCFMQILFISALCVLFNIRDVEEDRRSDTYSFPVLFGIKAARKLTYAILVLYALISLAAQLPPGFLIATFATFSASCLFTYRASHTVHPFYYGFGVDGLILLQSLLGILLL